MLFMIWERSKTIMLIMSLFILLHFVNALIYFKEILLALLITRLVGMTGADYISTMFGSLIVSMAYVFICARSGENVNHLPYKTNIWYWGLVVCNLCIAGWIIHTILEAVPDGTDYSWWQLAFYLIMYDVVYYPLHYLAHHPAVYKWIHAVHHHGAMN